MTGTLIPNVNTMSEEYACSVELQREALALIEAKSLYVTAWAGMGVDYQTYEDPKDSGKRIQKLKCHHCTKNWHGVFLPFLYEAVKSIF